MYRLARSLDPDGYHRMARAAYGEMALAGITCVGEFHYLHHAPGGVPYADPNAMGAALVAAAAEAGIRITLLDTCYLHGGIGAAPEGVQRRFSDGDADAWAERADATAGLASATARVGAAVHSVRAVDPAGLAVVAGWAAERRAPVHAHVSEQPPRTRRASPHYGRTPTSLLADAGLLSDRFTAVHATHVTRDDIALLGRAAATACLCPTTERDLGDGIGPAARLATAGTALSLGTDSHALVDPFEEMRAVEMHERVVSHRRGNLSAPALLRAATEDGHRSLGWAETGALRPARSPTWSRCGSTRSEPRAPNSTTPSTPRCSPRPPPMSTTSSSRAAGSWPEARIARWTWRASWPPRYETRWWTPRERAERANHQLSALPGPKGRALVARIPTGAPMSATVIDRIGLLVTNDPDLGEGPLGVVRDAAVVVESERVVAVTSAGAAGDDRIDAAGRCVLPGFVDSHTHLVFAGDRGDEFAARMAGAPYEAGGIRVTVEATRAAGDAGLAAAVAARADEALRQGITTVEVKSGYGLTAADERRCLQVAEAVTPHTTYLGAHVVPPEFDGRPDDYVELVCGAMLTAAAPHARWVDAFCERGAFDADQCRAVLTAGHDAGLGMRLHANQLGPGPGVQLAVELGCASADHCTHLSDADVTALAGSDDRGDVPARHRLLDPPAVPGRTAGARRRGDRRPGDQLQPGHQLHDLDGVLHRARGAGDGDDRRRGRGRRDGRGRRRAATRRRRASGARVPGGRRRARRTVARAPRVPTGDAADPRHDREGPRRTDRADVAATRRLVGGSLAATEFRGRVRSCPGTGSRARRARRRDRRW